MDTFKRSHAQAVNNLNRANDFARAANEGKQKLVDNEKKAKSNLSAEKKKTTQLSKEVTYFPEEAVDQGEEEVQKRRKQG